jgi:hypothetical protein
MLAHTYAGEKYSGHPTSIWSQRLPNQKTWVTKPSPALEVCGSPTPFSSTSQKHRAFRRDFYQLKVWFAQQYLMTLKDTTKALLPICQINQLGTTLTRPPRTRRLPPSIGMTYSHC